VIHKFIIGLEKAFEVERTKISLADEWAKDLPDGEDNADLAEYLELVSLLSQIHLGYLLTRSRLGLIRIITTLTQRQNPSERTTMTSMVNRLLFTGTRNGNGKRMTHSHITRRDTNALIQGYLERYHHRGARLLLEAIGDLPEMASRKGVGRRFYRHHHHGIPDRSR
jgi:hypothetical protein